MACGRESPKCHHSADPIALRWTICILAGLGWAPFVTYIVLAKRAAHRKEYAQNAASAGLCCMSLAALETEMAQENSVGAASCRVYMVVLCNWVIPVCVVAPLGTSAAALVALAWVMLALVVGSAVDARTALGEASSDCGGGAMPEAVAVQMKDYELDDKKSTVTL